MSNLNYGDKGYFNKFTNENNKKYTKKSKNLPVRKNDLTQGAIEVGRKQMIIVYSKKCEEAYMVFDDPEKDYGLRFKKVEKVKDDVIVSVAEKHQDVPVLYFDDEESCVLYSKGFENKGVVSEIIEKNGHLEVVLNTLKVFDVETDFTIDPQL